MATQLSNQCKYQQLRGEVHFHSDTFKILLMSSSFVFNPVTHTKYADVSASQLAQNYGYLTGGLTLTGVAVTKDDTSNKGVVSWSPATWSASGGNIGPSAGAIIYDDTDSQDMIVGYLDFGAAKTTLDGGVFTIASIKVENL